MTPGWDSSVLILSIVSSEQDTASVDVRTNPKIYFNFIIVPFKLLIPLFFFRK
jgi:hypothetical protein